MDIALLTLRYSPTLGAFDDAPLRALARDRELLTLREHFFVVEGQPHLLCIISSRARGAVTRGVSQPAPEPSVQPDPARAASPTKPATQSSEVPEGLSKFERELYNQIRRWRAGVAEQAGVPRYVVLTNRDVEALVRNRPDSLTGLRRLPGIGKAKVDNYGEALLELLHPKPEAAEPAAPVAPAAEPEGDHP